MGECINHLGTKAVQKTGMQEANYEWILLAIDTVSNLVFWSRFANKLEPWHNVYII